MAGAKQRAAMRTRTGCGVLTASASERNSICSVIVPADGTRAATAGKRRLRYVCVFWAALGQAGACSYPITWGARRKAQWLVENLKAEHLLGVAEFANRRGGSSSEALRVQSSRLAISTEEARVRLEGERMFQPLDLANWRDRPHMRRGSTNQCNPRRRQGGDLLCSRLP